MKSYTVLTSVFGGSGRLSHKRLSVYGSEPQATGYGERNISTPVLEIERGHPVHSFIVSLLRIWNTTHCSRGALFNIAITAYKRFNAIVA